MELEDFDEKVGRPTGLTEKQESSPVYDSPYQGVQWDVEGTINQGEGQGQHENGAQADND